MPRHLLGKRCLQQKKQKNRQRRLRNPAHIRKMDIMLAAMAGVLVIALIVLIAVLCNVVFRKEEKAGAASGPKEKSICEKRSKM